MHIRKIFLLAAIASLSAGYAQVNPYKTSFNAERSVIPLQYRSGTSPVVKVKINGKGPYNFLFDTGSPGLLKLDERLFKQWELPVIDSVRAGDGSGVNAQVFPVTAIAKLELGDFVITNSHAMVRNYNTRAGTDSIDGVIGMEFFNGVLLEFRFDADQLIIQKGSLRKGAPGVQETVYRNGVPATKINVAGKEIQADFDTGNMGWLTLHANTVTTDMMATQPRVIGTAKTVANTFEIKEVQLKEAAGIGGLLFEKPTVVLNEMLRHANMGIKFLRQMNIVFDKKNSLVKLVKAEQRQVKSIIPADGNEYTGQYGDRTITLGTDGNLYIQRPGGMLLKMTETKKDEYTLERVPGSVIMFVRNAARNITAIKVGRGDGNWETVGKQ
ncbi:MAG TPA: retropepsin-like aspartic protease [Chitinophagaceae bacterium]|nr:retropepsin-like aspartic protease [Chitinophagaceae bacterium]